MQPEHDRRRAPATYDRILQNITGHEVIVHCTVTRQLLARTGYLREFTDFWSNREEVRKIWFSLFTPQDLTSCEERLTVQNRRDVIRELDGLRQLYPKVHMPKVVLEGLLDPPASPQDCLFAQMTTCVSADLLTPISPCQFGGRPTCSECGCMASAGLASVGKYKVAGLIPISQIFSVSKTFGEFVNQQR